MTNNFTLIQSPVSSLYSWDNHRFQQLKNWEVASGEIIQCLTNVLDYLWEEQGNTNNWEICQKKTCLKLKMYLFF